MSFKHIIQLPNILNNYIPKREKHQFACEYLHF